MYFSYPVDFFIACLNINVLNLLTFVQIQDKMLRNVFSQCNLVSRTQDLMFSKKISYITEYSADYMKIADKKFELQTTPDNP